MKVMTTSEFIRRANKIHKNTYRYNNTEYVRGSDKVAITCVNHGDFKQTPADHIYGKYGCAQCKFDKIATQRVARAVKTFAKKARQVHKSRKYDYSKVGYTNAKTPVEIRCTIHNHTFSVSPNKHLSGWGCVLCSHQDKRLSTKDFIDKARQIHGATYDYSGVQYYDYYTEVTIICPKHGKFLQSPERHLHTRGCSKCFSASKGEAWITDILLELGIPFIREKTFREMWIGGSRPRFDFWLPLHNLLIEYDGKQHTTPHKFANHTSDEHTLQQFETTQINDRRKTRFASSQNIRLLRIDYIQDTRPKIEQILKQALV